MEILLPVSISSFLSSSACNSAFCTDISNFVRIGSDGQKLTKKLLTISLINFLFADVVILNKNNLVKTVD